MFFVIYLEGHQSSEEYFRSLEGAYKTFMQYTQLPPFLQVSIDQFQQELTERGSLNFEIGEWHFETRFFEEDIPSNNYEEE